MDFESVALLVPVAVALGVPMVRGKRLAIFAGVLAAVVLILAGAFGAPFGAALRVCAIGLALTLLAAGLSFKRVGPLVVGLTFAILIGSVFLLSPAIAALELQAEPILAATLNVSPYAAVSSALGRDFLHDDFFYRQQDPAPADYRLVYAPWYRGPLIYAAFGLAALALGRLARGARPESTGRSNGSGN